MKRSKTIQLTIATGATLMVTGCDEDTKPHFYKDNAACMQELRDTEACGDAEKDALAQHMQSAPKFTSKEECEQKFGANNCVQPTNQPQSAAASGGGFFMPMMMGYMLGKMGGGGGWFGGRNYATQPVYRDRDDNAYTGGSGGGRAGTFTGNRFQPSQSFMSNWSSSRVTPMVRRGGFGTSSHFAGS